MSEYVMLPGARLEVGPGGKPYETLGAAHPACCAPCNAGRGKCKALGSSDPLGVPSIGWAVLGVLGYVWFTRRKNK